MKSRLLLQLANAAKILKVKTGYADSSLKRSATLILNNKSLVGKDVINLANKFKDSLKSRKARISSASNKMDTPKEINKAGIKNNFDISDNATVKDKLSLLNSFSKFRQRLLLFDFVMGSLRDKWWIKPLLVIYLIISYLFSAYILARLTFLIEILQLDFWGIVDYIKNMDLNEIEGIQKEWNPIPFDPNAPNVWLNRTQVEENPFAGNYIKLIDPKEYAIDQFNRAKLFADQTLDKLTKSAKNFPDLINSDTYTKALQGLHEAYNSAINSYGSISEFRKALGVYTGVKGWFNSWIGYPVHDAVSWMFSGNPYYLMAAFVALTACFTLFKASALFSLIMFLPLKVLAFPVECLDWLLVNYIDTYIVAFNNKLNYISTKTGISELFNWMEGRELDESNLDDAISYHNNQMAGLKTYPSTANTDRMGQGVIRHSVIDYVNDLGEHPDNILDKGKGPDDGSFKDFLRKWFAGSNDQNTGTVEQPIVTVVETDQGEATRKPSLIVPRVISRTPSGYVTPNRPSTSGIGIALETDATEDALAAAKLSRAVTPADDPSSPRVRLSAKHMSASDNSSQQSYASESDSEDEIPNTE